MKGYRKDAKATDEAFKDGWFQTGDLAVVHPDGHEASLPRVTTGGNRSVRRLT